MPAGWSAIGAGLFCPVVTSPAPGRIVLLARTAGGELVRRDRLPGGGWGTARALGVPTARSQGGGMDVPVDWQLAACCGGSGPDGAEAVELVARSPDGDLLHARLGTDGRVRFECLGAPAEAPAGRAIPVGIASPPAACHGAPDRLDVFAVGQAGDLLHAVRSGGEWTPFDALGAPAGAPPAEAVAASSCGPSRIAVFRRGSAGDLLLKWWDGGRRLERIRLARIAADSGPFVSGGDGAGAAHRTPGGVQLEPHPARRVRARPGRRPGPRVVEWGGLEQLRNAGPAGGGRPGGAAERRGNGLQRRHRDVRRSGRRRGWALVPRNLE